MILLGLLMGFNDPAIRILSFMTAGAVWMYQAFSRRQSLDYWIALTLWALGVASVGLLRQYPGEWLPLLGVVLAAGFGLGGWLAGRQLKGPLSPALSPSEREREDARQSLADRGQL